MNVRKFLPRLQDLLLIVPLTLLMAINIIAFIWVARHMVAIHRLKLGVGDTVFYDGRGRPWFRMDEQRQDVPLSQISKPLRQAVIAVEDHRFYSHAGIDLIGVARATFTNIRAGGVVEGGSTLTQQLARTLFLSNRRTWGRKLKEAALALMLEQQLSKDRILELYLNRIYLSGGVYGVESMSRKLFGKRAREITAPEAAFMAGLIQAPSFFSPWTNPEGARKRSRTALDRMRQAGFISPEAEAAAVRKPPAFRRLPKTEQARAGYAKEFLRSRFRDRFGGEHPPDWKVETTFLPDVQDMAERAVTRGLSRFKDPHLQAALVAIDPQTGNILALVGGRDFSSSQYNRATRSRRQPGSAFKPFVFAAALENGYSPVSVITGLNEIVESGPQEYSPRNVHGETPEAMTLREALLSSNNRAAVALQRRINARPVIRLALAAGLKDLPDVPSLALGTGSVTPLELTAAFAAFPNGGLAIPPRGIRRVLDADGSVAMEQPVIQDRVLSEQVAFQMVSMLEDVLDRGTAASARALGVTFQAAGKTGTTNEFRDAWFVGFSSSVVAGVWVGHDHPAPIGPNAFGARVALPIWADFMRQTARVLPPGRFRKPEGLRDEPLCRVSYLRPMEDCPTYIEYLKGNESVPTRLCPVHSGTLKQRGERVVQTFLGGVANRIRGLFGGKKE